LRVHLRAGRHLPLPLHLPPRHWHGGHDSGGVMQRARMLALLAAALATVASTHGAHAQSVLDRTPNVAGTWTLPNWSPLFVFTHRFEFIADGDELINIPTLQLALGIPAPRGFGLAAGV